MSKFANYEVLSTDYKVVAGTGIAVDVILPNEIAAGKQAVIVRFHGGGWVTGTSLYEPWFPIWLLDLATLHNAIIVSPNYRLLPESTGLDVMADLDSVWEWINASSGLAALLKTSKTAGVEADLGRILTTGDSAGGYMSIQFALSHSKDIRACSATYPGIDFAEAPFSVPSPTVSPPLPADFVSSHLATTSPGQIATSDYKLARFPLVFAMMQHGTFLSYVGSDPILYPFERIKRGEQLPPLFVLHGSEDKIVPYLGSERLVKLVKSVNPDAKVVLEVTEGDHGLDTEWGIGHDSLKKGLELMVDEWIKS